ncbi:hypothetical protein H8959_007781 [Pygathrix nigripes]
MEKCVCTGGAIQCGDFRCPSGSHCQLSSDNSKSNCVSDSKGSDRGGWRGEQLGPGLSYRFQGRMTYVLIKTVDVLPEGVEPLLVEGRNKMDPPRSSTFLQEVITTVYGYKVQLQAGLELVVNNQKMAVPYRPNEHLRVTLRGQRLYLVTDFELVISFGGRKNAAMECPAGTMYQSCMTPCPASCANLPDPGDCEGPCMEGCASIPGYAYSGTQSLPLADCGCTSNGIYYQLGSSFVTEDCSQRCTCASSRILLCEPFSCSEGEVCTLGNHTRGCFPESPCLRNPCQNDGQCQEQGATFTCECEVGYGGDLCTEPRDVPAPRKPASNPVAVLLGLLVPVVVVVLAVTRECIYRMRRKSQCRHSPRIASKSTPAVSIWPPSVSFIQQDPLLQLLPPPPSPGAVEQGWELKAFPPFSQQPLARTEEPAEEGGDSPTPEVPQALGRASWSR